MVRAILLILFCTIPPHLTWGKSDNDDGTDDGITGIGGGGGSGINDGGSNSALLNRNSGIKSNIDNIISDNLNINNQNSNNNNQNGDSQLTSRIVHTKHGAVSGSIIYLQGRHLDPVESFKGIPYASPPVGSLRFMPPVTGALWSGVKKADRWDMTE